MKRLWTLACAFFLIGGLSAQSLESPNGDFEFQFYLNEQGAPTYTLSYKDTQVIKPSTLGFELKRNIEGSPASFDDFAPEADREKNDRLTNLHSGFTVVDTQTATFDETWRPVDCASRQTGSVGQGRQ